MKSLIRIICVLGASLICAAVGRSQTVVYDTILGHSLQTQDWVVGGANGTAVAFAFSPTSSGFVSEVDLTLYRYNSSNNVVVQLWSNASGSLGSLLETASPTTTIPWNQGSQNSPTDPVAVSLSASTWIVAGQTYWLEVAPGDSSVFVGWALTSAPLVVNMQSANTATSGPWVAQSTTPGGFTVVAVPEPATYAAAFGVFALGLGLVWRKLRVRQS